MNQTSCQFRDKHTVGGIVFYKHTFLVPKYFARLSCDRRMTFLALSRTCRREILANLQCEIFVTLVRMSCNNLEKTYEHLATIWRENKTKRHSYECRATLSRMSCDCRENGNKTIATFVRTSRDTLATATHSRQSVDIFSNLDQKSRNCRINVNSMRLQRESCVYIANFCREIVANNSRTSLQLSHSSDLGA